MTLKLNLRAVISASAVIALVPLCSFATDSSHMAITHGESLHMTIRYADLNLASPEGAQALYSRITHAAAKVCPLVDSSQNIIGTYEPCVQKAISDAVLALNLPQLTKLYAQNSGHPITNVTVASTTPLGRLDQ